MSILIIQTEIKKIKGRGKGLFTKEFLKKGTIVFYFGNKNVKLISQDEYIKLVKQNYENAIRTEYRIFPYCYAIYNSEKENICEYINYSFNPSIIYYFGLYTK